MPLESERTKRAFENMHAAVDNAAQNSASEAKSAAFQEEETTKKKIKPGAPVPPPSFRSVKRNWMDITAEKMAEKEEREEKKNL